MSKTPSIDHPLGDEICQLWRVAQILAPWTFRAWYLSTVEPLAPAWQAAEQRWPAKPDWELLPLLPVVQAEICGERAVRDRRWASVLTERLVPLVRRAIGSPQCLTEGMNGDGVMVTIDRHLARQCQIDLIANTLSMGEGAPPRLWAAVIVRSQANTLWPEDAQRMPTRRSVVVQGPVYEQPVVYNPKRIPEEFKEWARAQQAKGSIITDDEAEDSMRGPKDGDGNRSGGLLLAGKGLSRDTVRKWVDTLPVSLRAKRGTPPSRAR